MTVEEKILTLGFEDVIFLSNYDYDTAFLGVTDDGRAVYDYNKMIDWLIKTEDFESYEEAAEWIDYNTIRALPYMGEKCPIIIYGWDDSYED